MTLVLRPMFLTAFAAVVVFLASFSPLGAQSLSGSYLAATQANYDNDYQVSVRYYARALARDPDNLTLLQNILLAYLAMGEVDTGMPVAQKMEGLQADSQGGRR